MHDIVQLYYSMQGYTQSIYGVLHWYSYIIHFHTQICQKDIALNNTYYVIGTLKTEKIMINGSDIYVSYNDTGATTVYNR